MRDGRTKPTLEAILADVERATDNTALVRDAARLRSYFDVGHIWLHWVNNANAPFEFGTLPDGWVRRYQTRGYHRIDPVIQACTTCVHPVDWAEQNWSAKPERAYLDDALAHGIGPQGFSVPIRGPRGQFAVLSVSRDCDAPIWAAFIARYRCDLILTAFFVNQAMLRQADWEEAESPQSLSPRELDAMTCLALGQSRAKAAATLSISEHTLRVYIESARFKLGAVNTTHAVARALSRGLIVI